MISGPMRSQWLAADTIACADMVACADDMVRDFQTAGGDQMSCAGNMASADAMVFGDLLAVNGPVKVPPPPT